MRNPTLVISVALLFVLMMSASCSGQAIQESDKPVKKLQTAIEFSSPEYQKTRFQVLIAGNFLDQLRYFYMHYGRVPSSFEEWRDSGLLMFTPWSGDPTEPSKHVEYTPTVENDPLGTFHYESIGNGGYKIEYVYEIGSERKVLPSGGDFNNPGSSVRTGYSYMEAKADASFAFLELLWILNLESPGAKPGSLIDCVDGYISLVPEAFRLPEGVEFDESAGFECGFELGSGKEYISNKNLRSWFKNYEPSYCIRIDWESKDENLSDDKLVLFSSDLLKAGYPGLFD